MNVYRKSLVIQLLLFFIFYLMGVYVIAHFYLAATTPWLVYAIFGVLLTLGVIGFTVYRRSDERVAVITEKELKLIRYLIYGYFAVYILQMILGSIYIDNKELLEIIAVASGSLLMIIATVGGVLQYKVLRVK